MPSENAPFYYVLRMKKNKDKVKTKADALMIKNRINIIEFDKIKPQMMAYIPEVLQPFIESE